MLVLIPMSRIRVFISPHVSRKWQAFSSSRSRLEIGLCWSCGSEMKVNDDKAVDIMSILFCGNEDCRKIQPLDKDMDYFDLLGLPEGKRKFLSSATSQDSLEKAYKGLQKRLHPDIFSNKSLMEQELSATNSALVNMAYQCLRDDISRAGYILSKYHGIDVLSETGGSHHDPELNMKIFELREEIDELDYGDESAVQNMVSSLKTSREGIGHALDAAIEKGEVDSITKEAVKLRYWVKMIEEVDRRGDN